MDKIINNLTSQQKFKRKKSLKARNICVISGGGNRGAVAVGYLNNNKQDFDLVVGTSTGALMSVHVAMGWYNELKDLYLNITQDEIINKNKIFGRLFNKKGKIRLPVALYRIIKGKKSLADSFALRSKLTKSLTLDKWKEFKASKKEAVVGVYNLTKKQIEYKSSNNFSYEEFIDWMWISANQPPIMSVVEKNGDDYVDGGVSDVIGIDYIEDVSRMGDKLTIIELRPKEISKKRSKIDNIFDLFKVLITSLRKEIIQNDSQNIPFIKNKGVEVAHVFLPYGYGENDLIFSKEKMLKFYNQGFNHKK